MRILVACEMSGIVRRALRAKGHEAYSCDLLPSLDNSPYHYIGDVTSHLSPDFWDALVGFPPCTYLCGSGYHWCYNTPKKPKKDVLYGPARMIASQEALAFFLKLWKSGIKRIALENSLGILSTRVRKPHQIIQPWQFGHPESKQMCFWLEGLPPLKPTKDVYNEMMLLPMKQRTRVHYMSAKGEKGLSRSEARSLSFQGVADAMAEQWFL